MAVSTNEVYEVAGGTSLKAALSRAERRTKVRAFLLVVPLLVFISFTFLAPIAQMMFRSIDNPVIAKTFPNTLIALQDWDPAGAPTPPEAVFAAFAAEMSAAFKRRSIGRAATRLNYDTGGMRSLMTKTARRIARVQAGPFMEGQWKEKFLEIDKRWGEQKYWTTIKYAGDRYTISFFLKALDFGYDENKAFKMEPETRRLYLMTGNGETFGQQVRTTLNSVWARTFWISGVVTIACVLLGYPVAYLLANLPIRISNLLMILVLLPFWTSLLVRTTAWIVVLQTEGVLNDVLMFFGFIDERIQLIFNRFGVLVSMTHILLPFMILPIYSVMKNIPPSYERAARSLGATPWTAFWKVYFPQSLAGIGAGGLLVFILALGYYITPALVGGPTDQMVSYFIADHTNRSLNWGLAGALGAILLAGVLAVYILYDKLVGIDNMKLRDDTVLKIIVYGLLLIGLAFAVRGSIRGLRNLPPYVGPLGRTWYVVFRVICGAILVFLITPILVIIPLSFNSEPYFTYPIPGFSLRWYMDFFVGEKSDVWQLAIKNSCIIAIFATIMSTFLGTVAAVGLSNSKLPGKTLLMGILISPMIVPLVITAVGMKFFYTMMHITPNQLADIHASLHLVPIILAHAALGTPFVVITVTATLVGFDHSLTRASASLGAGGMTTFFKITVPLVMPGMISGALFAFITSFDEVVIVLFLAGAPEYTIPRQMFSGIREQISPTILAVATVLVLLSIVLLSSLEALRRRNERMRGITPQ